MEAGSADDCFISCAFDRVVLRVGAGSTVHYPPEILVTHKANEINKATFQFSSEQTNRGHDFDTLSNQRLS
jgi:hypothetical protein